MTRIGFIGLGTMGGPMALNLVRAGFDVTVWNRTGAKCAPLVEAGARQVEFASQVASHADAVHLCLLNPQAVHDVVFGEGLLVAMKPPQILVDHGTTGLHMTQTVATAAMERGVPFVDAPISGGVEGAREASLAIMAGGEREAYDRILPTLNALGQTVRYTGPSGSGQALKLANQLLVIIHQMAASEAFVFARKAGVGGQVFAEVLTNAWGRSFMLERSLPNFLANDHAGGRTNVAMFLKDAWLIADDAPAPLPVFDAAKERLEQAIDARLGEDDITAALKLYWA
ncbi:MAG: NAD(P)-dependent oxidoreductase [Chloroflexi bacterium]|nr:NAD(P)-dependent oxidoreductase [Chloroflexota bacterium]